MVVTLKKTTKIYGKMHFNRWTLAITAVPTTLTSRFSDNWLGTSAVIHIYHSKARARRNGYRMFISVFILCQLDQSDCKLVFIILFNI